MCAEMRDDMEYYEFVDEMAEKIKMCFGKEVAVECLKSRKEQIDSTPWENSFYDSNFDLLVRLFGL